MSDKQVEYATISIHAPRTGSDPSSNGLIWVQGISIHAPRTGSDGISSPDGLEALNFNPRSPHGERPSRTGFCCSLTSFQSTLPARGATRFSPSARARGSYFNPRSPHGERRRHRLELLRPHDDFNPRSPHGERRARGTQVAEMAISIHAPRTGSDRRRRRKAHCRADFNPRSPHGERRGGSSLSIMDFVFQSTLPARGATVVDVCRMPQKSHFNPRSPHGERRQLIICLNDRRINFNPRSPHGERP